MNFNFRLVMDFSISSDSIFDFFIINPGNHTALSYCIETKCTLHLVILYGFTIGTSLMSVLRIAKNNIYLLAEILKTKAFLKSLGQLVQFAAPGRV